MNENLLDFTTYYVCHDKNEDVRYLIKPMKNRIKGRITASGYDPEWFDFSTVDYVDQLGIKRVVVRAVPYGYCTFDMEMREV